MSAWLCPYVCGSRESSEHSGRNTRNDRRVPCDSADGMPLHHATPRLREPRSIRRPLSVTSATLSVKRYRRAFAAMETRLYADLSGAFTPLGECCQHDGRQHAQHGRRNRDAFADDRRVPTERASRTTVNSLPTLLALNRTVGIVLISILFRPTASVSPPHMEDSHSTQPRQTYSDGDFVDTASPFRKHTLFRNNGM